MRALESLKRRGRTTVPVDDQQTSCALSGESFETVFDEDTQEWHYRDCARLTEQEGEAFGLAPGSLVLLSVAQGAMPAAAAVGAVADAGMNNTVAPPLLPLALGVNGEEGPSIKPEPASDAVKLEDA